MSLPKFVKDVLSAYKKTGLKPIRHSFYEKNSACPIGVLAKVNNKNSRETVYKWAIKKFGEDFVNNFTNCFDGCSLHSFSLNAILARRYAKILSKKLFNE